MNLDLKILKSSLLFVPSEFLEHSQSVSREDGKFIEADAKSLKGHWFLNGARDLRHATAYSPLDISSLLETHSKLADSVCALKTFTLIYQLLIQCTTSAGKRNLRTEAQHLTWAEFYDWCDVTGEKLWTKEQKKQTRMSQRVSRERGEDEIRSQTLPPWTLFVALNYSEVGSPANATRCCQILSTISWRWYQFSMTQ